MENDSYAYVGYLRGDTKVLDYLGQAECAYVSVFVMGELYAGFRAGDKEKENKQILERFLMKSTVSVLEASKETAEIFGLIKESLRKIGRPIPVNAVWIGTHALETGSVLLTYDRHFAFIPGLRLWDELQVPDGSYGEEISGNSYGELEKVSSSMAISGKF